MEKRMEKKEVFVETCKKCGREVKGQTEEEVKHNFQMHLMSHKKEETSKA